MLTDYPEEYRRSGGNRPNPEQRNLSDNQVTDNSPRTHPKFCYAGGPMRRVRPHRGALIALWTVSVLWSLWDKNKQTLHDKVVGTTIVREKENAPKS